MYKVAVLMSIYNGEKYLKEQIKSILAQEEVEVELYARIDGSKDSSLQILEEFNREGLRIHIDNGANMGVGNSFMTLVYNAPSEMDYFAFADQDDIWESRKLIEAIHMLEQSGKSLYGSNQECVDKDGNTIGIRYAKDTSIYLTPNSILETNMIAGCTMVFNRYFCEILTSHRPSEALLRNRIHDVWVAMVGSLYDSIIYDERSYMKYRQHENNVVGAYAGGFGDKLKQKWKRLINKENRCGRSILAKNVCDLFPDKAAIYPLLEHSAKAHTLTGKKYLLKNRKELLKYTSESELDLIVKILFNLF